MNPDAQTFFHLFSFSKISNFRSDFLPSTTAPPTTYPATSSFTHLLLTPNPTNCGDVNPAALYNSTYLVPPPTTTSNSHLVHHQHPHHQFEYSNSIASSSSSIASNATSTIALQVKYLQAQVNTEISGNTDLHSIVQYTFSCMNSTLSTVTAGGPKSKHFGSFHPLI